MTLAQTLDRYYLQHGKNLPTKNDIAGHCRRLLEHFGAATVAELTLPAVEGFVAAMRAAKRSNAYTDRILDTARAALSHAYRRQEITHIPHLPSLKRERFERPLVTNEEIRALWDAAEEPHLRMFLILLLNTGARPNALLAATRFQVDRERRLLDLHPRGRQETRKRNPVLPITDHLWPWLKDATGNHLVEYRGKPVACIKSAWRRARHRAGLPQTFVPYSIRHTLASELRRRGVPEWEAAGWLGHATSYRTTEIYARFRPDYLMTARVCVDAWMKEIGLPTAIGSPIMNPVRARSVSGPNAGAGNPLESGRSGKIRTCDPSVPNATTSRKSNG